MLGFERKSCNSAFWPKHVKKEHLDYFRTLLCGIFFAAALSPRCSAAAPSPAAGSPSVPQTGTRLAEAVRSHHAPNLDGTLDDPLWQSAKPIPDFRQKGPYEGQPPTEKTEVRILYTRESVTQSGRSYARTGTAVGAACWIQLAAFSFQTVSFLGFGSTWVEELYIQRVAGYNHKTYSGTSDGDAS